MEKGNHISEFVRVHRQKAKMTQQDLADRAGVGLRFIRDLEQGKTSLRLDKVNQVLRLFGHVLNPGSEKNLDPWEIQRHHLGRSVEIHLKNKQTLYGVLLKEVRRDQEIVAWRFVSRNHMIAYQKSGDQELTEVIQHTDIESIKSLQ